MKIKSLAFKIWIIVTSILLVSFLAVILVYSIFLRTFFVENTFERIEEYQDIKTKNIRDKDDIVYFDMEDLENIKKVQHIIIPKKQLRDDFFINQINQLNITKREWPKNAVKPPIFTENFMEKIHSQINNQKEDTKRYESEIGNNKLYYSLRKINIGNQEYFLMSYLWDNYHNIMIKDLLSKLIYIIIFFCVISIIIAIIVSQNITRPLMKLERFVYNISKKEYCEDIILDRHDEIGRLAESMNLMKDELKKADLEQQNFLQSVSHGLKTPVMVIQSYAQALLDEIYLNNSFDDTVNVIIDESKNLEHQICQLLYFNSLDYILDQGLNKEDISLKELIYELIDRFSLLKSKVKWYAEVEDIYLNGDYEKIKVALENIFENAIRYVEREIRIKCYKQGENINISIYNDGPSIKKEMIGNVFDKFKKDKDGKFGIGLSITNKIISIHGGEINVKNIYDGVCFYIVFKEL